MKGLFDFLDGALSPYHAVKMTEEKLRNEGFRCLEEGEKWEIEPGGRYYVTRNQSSLLAFILPKGKIMQYHITASHSDSPTFRIKKNKCQGGSYAKAEVEGYGGMILSGWLDRPLTFAGRVIVRTSEGISTRLVKADRDIFVIPNVSVHLNREINKGYVYNPQADLQPLYGGKDCDLQTAVREALGDSAAEILDTDLVLAVRQKAVRLGTEREFYMSPRIDDLACVYTTLCGFLSERAPSDTTADVFCMFDNEEVGSGTRQGALSAFLPEVMYRMEMALHMTPEECAAAHSRSMLISADNAHGIHPNHPEKSDTEFPVLLNEGIVIKYNASQKYTTTGMTAAVFSALCEKEDIPVQRFANRADSPGGSTLGNLLSHQLSIPMLDIGLAQLAMHSAVETAGCRDVSYMIRAIQAFYAGNIAQVKDGTWQIS